MLVQYIARIEFQSAAIDRRHTSIQRQIAAIDDQDGPGT